MKNFKNIYQDYLLKQHAIKTTATFKINKTFTIILNWVFFLIVVIGINATILPIIIIHLVFKYNFIRLQLIHKFLYLIQKFLIELIFNFVHNCSRVA